MADKQLTALLYPTKQHDKVSFSIPDWTAIHQELKRKELTKWLLWEEYEQSCEKPYSYSQFCRRYNAWLGQQKRSMRQVHKAGEKCFIDYAGPTIGIIDRNTGEIKPAQIFVGVLGASNYTYAEATWSQKTQDWLMSHVRMLEFFGGVPEMLVPDNLKSGVTKACRYDPDINASYQQLAEHYQVAVMPARPLKPKDKAKAEVGVQVVERWIMAKLRKQIFFSLAELNHVIAKLLDDLNQRPFKKLPGNRREAFEKLDQPALKVLPKHAYQYVDIRQAKVNIDYHISYDNHHYSIPHNYVGEKVQIHASDKLIEIYFNHKLLASHVRKTTVGMTTDSNHMPTKHAKHQQWTPGRLKNWAKDIGADTLKWITDRLNEKQHPEQAYRVSLGLLNLTRSYPAERINKACGIANKQNLNRLKQIKSILRSNQDRLPEQATIQLTLPQDHENLRGAKHYH
jgi:transposase